MNDAGTPVMLANGKRLELPFTHIHELAGGVAAEQAQQQQYIPPSPVAP
jgi:hypothetical protein